MDKGEIYSQMSAYNFAAPIKVTMIFDSDDDNDIIEQKYEINRKKENIVIKKEIDTDYNKQNDQRNFDYRINQNNLELHHNVPRLMEKRKVDVDVNTLTVAGKRRKPVKKNSAQEKSEKIQANKHQLPNNQGKTYSIGKNQLVKQYEDVWISLSGNVVLFMYSYYQIQKKILESNDEAEQKMAEQKFEIFRNDVLEKTFNQFKYLILMLDNDAILTDSFLDLTVKQAAIKKDIKCTRAHVKPFVNDMILYTKNRQNFQRVYQPQLSEDNPILNSNLSRKPIATSNMPIYNNLNNSNQSSPDNRCIFSSGPPGREITISLPSRQPGQHVITNLPTDSYNNPPNIQVCNDNTFSSINHNTPDCYMLNNFEMQDCNQPTPRERFQINSNDCNRMVQAKTWHPNGPQPPDYHLHHSHYSHQQTGPSTMNSSTIDTSRSSVSTESGYISPSFSPSYELKDTGNSEGITMTPTISNVFSLYPNKSNYTSGPCLFCGKYTQERSNLHLNQYCCSKMCEQFSTIMYENQRTHHRLARI